MSDSVSEEQQKLVPADITGYAAYNSDREFEDGPSTSCGTAQMTSNSPDWMAEMGPKMVAAKVGEVVWPGTHDSGAYCEEFDFNKVVDDHWLRYVGVHLLRCLGPRNRQFASDWARTQSLSIRQQLEHGVRYIDLRISKCSSDNQYYIVHSFCGPALRGILNDIQEFFSAHPQECLLMSIQPVFGVDHNELHNIIERKLGGLLLKREPDSYPKISPISLTISHLLSKGRIVVFYKLFTIAFGSDIPCFWNYEHLYSPFIMSLDPLVKENFQLERFTEFASRYHRSAKEKYKRIFHFMYALTPTLCEILKSSDIAKYLVSPQTRTKFRSLQDCAQTMNPRLCKFMERIKNHVVSEGCQDMGMIVSIDFVEESDLVQRVIALNIEKFKT